MRVTAERYLSLQDVGDELGISDQTVRRWVKAGDLAAYKPGKEYRIKGSDLEEFLKTREVVAPKVRSPRPDFDIQERRNASFGDAIIAAADTWKRAAAKPNASPAKIIGIVGTILDLHDAISTPLDNEAAWEGLTSAERREVIAVLQKLNEAAEHVLDHAGETAEVAELEERVKQRRADMRERTRRISA